ncbi:MAG: dihydropteroate synthase [Zetaproteobacteria bacterium]|nr:dihydropteroate synthase [Pseudobdellovibrionaceae bacterium]|tara:strand:- start:1104 stop:1928 length:825 start_codon:yes stop_codon:yes gene_type:complete
MLREIVKTRLLQDQFLILGILNLTPDSFSDGSLYFSPKQALDRALKLLEDGADILDLGGESTRPGAQLVDSDEEWRRLEPVIRSLKNIDEKILISIDTSKPLIMKKAVDLGVSCINNVCGLVDDKTLEYIASAQCSYIAMHMHGVPQTMQACPLVKNQVLEDVNHFFSLAHQKLLSCGFTKDRIWMDPGIGFGKTDSSNLLLLRSLKDFSEKYNMAVGLSRKSFLGRIFNIEKAQDRDLSSKAFEINAFFLGARMIRTHDVKNLKSIMLLGDRV